MEQESIELTLINNPFSDDENGFGIIVKINNEEKIISELNTDQMLHIGGILLKATKCFINNADTNDRKRKS